MVRLGALSRLVVVLVSALSLAACAWLQHAAELRSDLQRAGYGDVRIDHQTHNGYDTLTITLTSSTAEQPITAADVLPIAKIVWETYPEQVDTLRVQLNGERVAMKRLDLEREFGPRKPGLESGSDNSLLVIAICVVAGGAVLLIVILIVRRHRRRTPPPDPGYSSVFPTAPTQT